MIKKEANSMRDLFGELFLIIGGFILAETIINQFLSLSQDKLPGWVLPLFAILLIITALDFRNNHGSFFRSGLLSVLFLGGSIVLIVLMKNNLISNITFLWSIFVLSILIIVIHLILFLFKRKKNKR